MTMYVKLLLLHLTAIIHTSQPWPKISLHKRNKHERKGHKGLEEVDWLLDDSFIWNLVLESGAVHVWTLNLKSSDYIFVKAEAIIDASPEALREVLTPGDVEVIRVYNPLVVEGKDIKYFGKDSKISWSRTMPIWPCRARDFVTLINRMKFSDGSTAIVQKATAHPSYPPPNPEDSVVRAEILHGLFLIEPQSDSNRSKFTMIQHINPGGKVPVWLTNQIAAYNPASFIRALGSIAVQFDTALKKDMSETKGSRSKYCIDRAFDSPKCLILSDIIQENRPNVKQLTENTAAFIQNVSTTATRKNKTAIFWSTLLLVLVLSLYVFYKRKFRRPISVATSVRREKME